MKRFVVAASLLCIAATAFAQGLYYEAKIEGAGSDRGQQMYMAPKKMKTVDVNTQGNSVMIVRLDKEVMWQLNPAKKTYSEITFAQLEQMVGKMGAKMDAAMAKMQKELEGLPPDQRKMVEEMMKGKMPGMGGGDAPVTVRNTGDRQTISGFPCVKYVAMRGDEQLMTLWTTRSVQGFEEFAKDWKEFGKRMAALAPRFGKEMADAYKDIEGMPIKTQAGGITTTVTKIERRSVPASEFEIPAGYTKTRSDFDEAMDQMEREEE